MSLEIVKNIVCTETVGNGVPLSFDAPLYVEFAVSKVTVEFSVRDAANTPAALTLDIRGLTETQGIGTVIGLKSPETTIHFHPKRQFQSTTTLRVLDSNGAPFVTVGATAVSVSMKFYN